MLSAEEREIGPCLARCVDSAIEVQVVTFELGGITESFYCEKTGCAWGQCSEYQSWKIVNVSQFLKVRRSIPCYETAGASVRLQ